MMETFFNNESGYEEWLRHHRHGFVLNLWKNEAPSNPIKLHKADCYWITKYRPGRYTTGDYYKVCADDRTLLEGWARTRRGAFEKCKVCNP